MHCESTMILIDQYDVIVDGEKRTYLLFVNIICNLSSDAYTSYYQLGRSRGFAEHKIAHPELISTQCIHSACLTVTKLKETDAEAEVRVSSTPTSILVLRVYTSFFRLLINLIFFYYRTCKSERLGPSSPYPGDGLAYLYNNKRVQRWSQHIFILDIYAIEKVAFPTFGNVLSCNIIFFFWSFDWLIAATFHDGNVYYGGGETMRSISPPPLVRL